MTSNPSIVLAAVRDDLRSRRSESASYTLQLLQEKKVKAGAGRHCDLRGVARRQQNQLLVETVSLSTLRSTLKTRGEQIWTCPSCDDPDDEYKV